MAHYHTIIFVAAYFLSAFHLHAGEVAYSSDIQPLFAERCYECHGPDKQKGDLRLDDRESTLASLADDELIYRLTTDDPDEQMPPEGSRLSAGQIEAVKTWVRKGARFENHWAYESLDTSPPPPVKNTSFVKNPIDQYVISNLEKKNITPSPEADRHTLVKRLYYDLIGLPPPPEIVDQFVRSRDPSTYTKLVDDLLASKHFGERWGRHWLDKARYADSDGYEKDRPRPNAWHYREWVINAINDDMPINQFTIEQLAGDLLPAPTDSQKLATAFHRQTLTNTEGGTDKEEFRTEAVFDRTETTAMIWLGLTMNCARCHNHKYDKIQQAEYYQLYSFFNNGDETIFKRPHSAEAMANYRKAKSAHEAELKAIGIKLEAGKAGHEEAYTAWLANLDKKGKPKGITAILNKPTGKRSKKELGLLKNYFFKTKYDATVPLVKKRDALVKKAPGEPVDNLAVIVQRETARDTKILERGSFLSPGKPVVPAGLKVLPEIPGRKAGQLDRLDLAHWLMSEENPLPPRVLANHVWEKLFGEGLIRTMNDFGVRGEKPDYPELLDWLGAEYRRLGWSRKGLIKTIVTSSTYRQASAHRSELLERDPNNHFLARQNRFRVEAEIARDLCLSIAGLISDKVGGPSVFPPLPPEVAELSYNNNFKWKNSEGPDRYRRGLYTFFKRTSPHPNLIAFDCPDSNTSNVKRRTSNTPIQALTMLNNEVYIEASQAFAKRVLSIEAENDTERISKLLKLCTSRSPEPGEVEKFIDLLNESQKWYQANPENAATMVSAHQVANLAADENAAWVAVARIALNLDELITRE